MHHAPILLYFAAFGMRFLAGGAFFVITKNP
jgi:hypothetical protein